MMMTNRRRSRYHIKAHSTRERFCFFFLKAILFFFFESDSVFILVWHQPVKTLENSVETRGGSIRLDDALRETPSRKSETLPEYFFSYARQRGALPCVFSTVHGVKTFGKK
jgi:hypothetical protein